MTNYSLYTALVYVANILHVETNSKRFASYSW